MLCQICQQNQANIMMKFILNGKEKQLQLCHSCYEKEKQKIATNFAPNNHFGSFPAFNQMPIDDLLNNMQYQPNPSVHDKQNMNHGNSFLDKVGRNLNQMAKAGLIDPVIGRDEEIARVIEILNRRNKNNPVLIGEAGVGKTAIAEGLASKIEEGSVPNKLKNKQVYLLDVASLVANTGIRGQFEERMKQLISELQHRKNIILFVDEIHLLVGAGSAEGSMDAGNLLKPALARGELQVIGATTLKEYRAIEKDAALERRFQPVIVDEPTIEAAVEILKGIQSKYEDSMK